MNDTRSVRPGDRAAEPPGRVVSRRRLRQLPSGRALVGGMLVAVAAAGVLVAHRTASQPPTTRFVIATSDVAVGETVRSDDLGTMAVDLPADMTAVPASDAAQLVGRVATTALAPFDLVRPGDVLEAGRFQDPDAVEVALELPPARALQGVIRPGSSVDVLSTDPDGDTTTVLASGVRVTSVEDRSDDGSIGSAGETRVLVSVTGTDAAARLVDAAIRSEITLVLPRPGHEGNAGNEGTA